MSRARQLLVHLGSLGFRTVVRQELAEVYAPGPDRRQIAQIDLGSDVPVVRQVEPVYAACLARLVERVEQGRSRAGGRRGR